MRYGQIRQYDVANGPGIRSTIFVTGCSHKCPGCFNAEYQDFSAGNQWTEKETDQVIEYLSDPAVEGLTLLGGEPMENLELVELLKKIKKSVDKTIWIYSGYTFEQIKADPRKFELLKECDVLVDGPFIEKKKDLKLTFRGSSNQRIIDIKKSLSNDSPVIIEI